jgi:hypothetical protein
MSLDKGNTEKYGSNVKVSRQKYAFTGRRELVDA